MGRENIFMSREGFDELFVTPPPDVYECPICLLVTNQAIQTICGHRFCEACILKVIREGRPNCPVDDRQLEESQVFPDSFARKEIACLDVRCRNNPQHGCNWIGNLKFLDQHLHECKYEVVACPHNCGERYLRAEMNEHATQICERRVVSCMHCNVKVVFKFLKDHYVNCTKLPIECPNTCGKVPREELTEHLQNSCPKSIMKCTFRRFGCLFEGNRQDMKTHTATSKDSHLENMVDTISKISVGYEHHRKVMQLEIDRLTSRVSELEHDGSVSKEDNSTDLVNKVEKLTYQVKSNVNAIQEINARAWNGCIIWKITNLKKLIIEAQEGTTPAIYSRPFYTDVPGYKLCCRINLNGVDCGEGSHVSIFIHIMQGEYDSIIQWPFCGDISFTIMDQESTDGSHNVTQRLSSHSSLQSFYRPTTSRNVNGYGYATMMSHQQLHSFSYVKDDSIMIKIEVKS